LVHKNTEKCHVHCGTSCKIAAPADKNCGNPLSVKHSWNEDKNKVFSIQVVVKIRLIQMMGYHKTKKNEDSLLPRKILH
jgi:hypothetical protein